MMDARIHSFKKSPGNIVLYPWLYFSTRYIKELLGCSCNRIFTRLMLMYLFKVLLLLLLPEIDNTSSTFFTLSLSREQIRSTTLYDLNKYSLLVRYISNECMRVLHCVGWMDGFSECRSQVVLCWLTGIWRRKTSVCFFLLLVDHVEKHQSSQP